MPQPEEVDEINEFLLKRREKQRVGELPREDFTPGFAKKISVAIFGKPRVEEKPLLKSTQPTYASSQAQAAMRQQLDEIMESRTSTTSRMGSAAPSPKLSASAPYSMKTSPAGPAPAPPKPAVPNYYSSMPYPPYIQRGLATLDKKNPVPAAKIAKPRENTPRPAAPAFTKPVAWPASTPKTIDRMTPPLAVRTNTSASAPLPPSTAIAANPPATKKISPLNAPVTNAPASGTRPISSAPKVRAAIPTPASGAAPPQKEPIPFWKKIFAKKENTPAPANVQPMSSPPKRTTPYYAAPSARTAPYQPLESIASAPLSRETPAIAPVSRTNTPSASAPEKKSPASANSLLPAKTPPVPMVTSPHEQAEEKNIPFSRPNVYTSPQPVTPVQRIDISATRPGVPTPPRATPFQSREKISMPEKKISSTSTTTPSSAPAQPYTPPWVARTMPRDAPTTALTPSAAGTLPWKQPFGTEAQADEKNSTALKTDSPAPAPKAISRTIDDEHVMRPREQASQEIDVRELEKPVMRDEALEEEISEEEALEKLPFEDVEGLSASDLDYLSKKEKEHRQAQEEKENDLGIPSQLKDTLQRQSSQLQGALQPGNAPTTDEKQEILRRLKKMMEDEGHS